MTDDFTRQLTSEQRERLRRSVDAPALALLLARLPAAERPLMLLSFYREPTAREALDALSAAGAGETSLEELRPFAEYRPPPPHLAHPENDRATDGEPLVWPIGLSVEPPTDRELRALWEAAEQLGGAS